MRRESNNPSLKMARSLLSRRHLFFRLEEQKIQNCRRCITML